MAPQNSSIYFHAPCFDGLVCAALLQPYLEGHLGWTITETIPITYSAGDGASWLDYDLPDRTAVADFSYHPNATVWVDHHGTTFKTRSAQTHYESSLRDPARMLIYDPGCPAGAALLWRHIGHLLPDQERYGEMVRWATVTDSADYATVEHSIFGDEPALRIAQTLGTSIDRERLCALLKALRHGTIDDVAQSSLVSIPFNALRFQIEAGLRLMRRLLVVDDDGMIASYEAAEVHDAVFPRYGAFFLEPNVRYMVSLIHSDRGSKISTSRNPWGPATNASIGSIFARYGGGGHPYAGSLQLPPGNLEVARQTFDKIVSAVRDAEMSFDTSSPATEHD